jgi:ribulose-phosphate 3-epimerase
LTFHLEACRHSQRYLTEIRSMGMAAGLSLNPQTPLCGLEYLLDACDHILIMTVNPGFGGQSLLEPAVRKIAELRRLIDAGGFSTLIEVDGGIDAGNAQRILAAGADVLVMGSAFFKERNRKALVREIKGLTPRGKQNARRPERVAGRPPIRGGAKPRSAG